MEAAIADSRAAALYPSKCTRAVIDRGAERSGCGAEPRGSAYVTTIRYHGVCKLVAEFTTVILYGSLGIQDDGGKHVSNVVFA